MTYQLVIFDFDGTLADTFPWFMRVMNSVADRYGFRRIEEHEVGALRQKGAREIVRHLGIPAWKLPLIARHMRRLAASDPDAARLFRGVNEMLHDLADAGIKIAVVSSNAEETIRQALGPGAAGLVHHYACGASMFGKAAKFRRVLKASGIAPARAICIGDEIRDYEAAREVGLAFGAVSWGYTDPFALNALKPRMAFYSISDLAPALIGERVRAA